MRKIINGIVATVIAAALVIAVGVGSSWFTNWNVKTWFHSWGKETQQPADPDASEDEPDEGMIVTPEETSSRMRMNAARSSTDPSSYTLTVTYEPSYALTPLLSWTVEFSDPDSAWAKGKTVTDYVAVSARGTTATVTCNEAFGEQVIVTATMTDKPDVSATCTVDYKAKYIGTSVALGVYAMSNKTLSFLYTHGDTELKQTYIPEDYMRTPDAQTGENTVTFYRPSVSAVTSIGTLCIPTVNVNYYVKLSEAFASVIESYTENYSDCNLTCPSDWGKVFEATFENVSDGNSIDLSTVGDFYGRVSGYFRALCPEVANTFQIWNETQWGYFRKAAYSLLGNPMLSSDQKYHFDVKIVATVDGEEVVDTQKVKFVEVSVPSANSLSVDQSALTF